MNGSSVLEVLRGFCAVLEGVDGRCATCVADAVEHSNEVLTSLGIQGRYVVVCGYDDATDDVVFFEELGA